jgi:hypothetical protein
LLLTVQASPLGDWKVFKIRLQNDELMVDSGLTLALLVELMPGLFSHGAIGSQCRLDSIRFRNIWVKVLAANE